MIRTGMPPKQLQRDVAICELLVRKHGSMEALERAVSPRTFGRFLAVRYWDLSDSLPVPFTAEELTELTKAVVK